MKVRTYKFRLLDSELVKHRSLKLNLPVVVLEKKLPFFDRRNNTSSASISIQHMMHSLRRLAHLLFFLALISLFSCNTLEEDASPEAIDTDALAPNRYTNPGQPMIVDLRRHIHAEGGLNFRVERQADHGNLNFRDDAFLKYEPDEFFEGKDFFVIGIYSGDRLISADSTVVEVGEAIAPCFQETLHDYYEVPINGYVGFDRYPNSEHCMDSVRITGLSYRSGDENGTLRFGFMPLIFSEIVYLPNPGFTGVDLVQYEVELSDENGRSLKANAVIAFEVTGSEAFLSDVCAGTWPNLLQTLDHNESDQYVIQVEFPQSGCDLNDYTVEIEYVSSGRATYQDGFITYNQEHPFDRFDLIQYIVKFPSGDVLRRRLNLRIEGGG